MDYEAQRVQLAYERRKQQKPSRLYSFFNKACLELYQQRERVLLSMLQKAFSPPLADKKIVDIGCGTGGTLLPMISYGFSPHCCYGVDILEDHVKAAQKRFPSMTFECCSAENCSFEKGSFDLVMMFTCLSSILDTAIRQKVCEASINLLKPGGWVFIYDFVVNNPSNPDVKAVRLNELDGYFRGFKRYSKKLTLLPPLGRMIGSYILCTALSWIPFLQTHRMTIYQKPDNL